MRVVIASVVLLGLLHAACDVGEKSRPSASASTSVSSSATTSSGAGGASTAPLAGTVNISLASSKPIAPTAFGQNYWNWEPAYGDPIGGTAPMATGMHLGFLRAGGDNNDTQMPAPFTNADIDAFVAYSRAIGAEPDLQVPLLYDGSGNPATPQTAADMVTYANKTKGYGIKYWSIGNEPDIYPTTTGLPAGFASYTAADYCVAFQSYASAMKAVDPTIRILGPELGYKYTPGQDWLTPFLDGCKDQVDIVTVHRYPLAPNLTTVDAAFADASAFRATIQSLRANLDAHGLQATPLGITEANITYDGTPSKSTLPASPSTFFAGLWTADVTGVALEQGLFTNAFWHVADAANGWKLAFILASQPTPAYYALSMFSAHMAGDALQVTGVPEGFSVYASHDATSNATAVMVLNKTAAAARLAIVLDSAPSQSITLDGSSLAALVIPAGGAPEVFRYTEALAAAGMGPTQDP